MIKRQLYSMAENGSAAPTPLKSHKMASQANDNGLGIFWSVNEFNGPRRAVNCSQILSWFCEIDGIDKVSQLDMLKGSPLLPSLVIESKRGYHIYWDARDATVDSYKEIESRINYHFGGDEKATLVTQLARVPGYYHLKDPDDPFLIRVVWQYKVTYTPTMMLHWFKPVPTDDEKVEHIPGAFNLSGTLFQKIESTNQIEFLKVLSGTSAVLSESYEFKRMSNGHHNIIVNGKGTSCFIDNEGRIGSSSGGGPLIWQWLRYFGYTHKEVYQILKTYLPELFK